MLERAKENGIFLVGPEAGVELIEMKISTSLEYSIEEFWHKGGYIEVSLKSCRCRVTYKTRESFPNEDTPCDCGKNMFVKYEKNVTVIDINKLKE